jgi:ABC-2 type transport system permease protein
MTKATTLEREFGERSDTLGPGVAESGGTSVVRSVWALFSTSLLRQVQSRRVLALGFLFVLPIIFAVLLRYNGAGWRGPTGGYEPQFAEFVLVYNLIPQALVPLCALVYASGMIQDEVEEQTITYLLIRPLPRWTIYAGKLASTIVVTTGLTAAFTCVTFLVIGWGQLNYWSSGGLARMLQVIALFAASLIAYSALFGLLSLLMRRAILIGVGYIILLEGFVSNIDFVIRKGTVMYHFRVLSERWMEIGHAAKYNIDLDTAPSSSQSLMILAGASLVMVILAGILMSTREFRVKTPEGS